MPTATLTKKSSKQVGILSSDFVSSRESCWISCKERLVFIGCGDDRPITEESAILLEQKFAKNGKLLNPKRGFASIFGGVAGEAKNVLIVGASIYGQKFMSDMGGFAGVVKKLIINSRDIQTLHSAAAIEKDQRHFILSGNESVGCAYCKIIGATSALLTDESNSLVRETAMTDQKYVFGSDHWVNQLINGHKMFLEFATNHKLSEFDFNRSDYSELNKHLGNKFGIMMLDWDHASAKTTGVISNFALDQVGSANLANQEGLDFYRLDIAKVTQSVLKSLKAELKKLGYSLPSELMMRAFQLDSTPVRAFLAAHDNDPEIGGKLDPRNIAIGSRGNVWDSISKLS